MLTADDLNAFLEANGIAYRTVRHRPVFHVRDGLDLKASLPGAHTKNLFLRDAKAGLWLVSALDDSRIDLKRLAVELRAPRLSFARPGLMNESLGVNPGSVTPFALLNDSARRVNFVLDATLAAAPFVNFHPLTNTATTRISQAGLRRFLEAVGVTARIIDFARLDGA